MSDDTMPRLPIPISKYPGWPRGMQELMAAAYVGLSASTIRALRKTGGFPAPVPLTPGRMVYFREHLDAWLDRKAGNAAPADDWPDA